MHTHYCGDLRTHVRTRTRAHARVRSAINVIPLSLSPSLRASLRLWLSLSLSTLSLRLCCLAAHSLASRFIYGSVTAFPLSKSAFRLHSRRYDLGLPRQTTQPHSWKSPLCVFSAFCSTSSVSHYTLKCILPLFMSFLSPFSLWVDVGLCVRLLLCVRVHKFYYWGSFIVLLAYACTFTHTHTHPHTFKHTQAGVPSSRPRLQTHTNTYTRISMRRHQTSHHHYSPSTCACT
ncbi:unnamed protein product [Hydatigera taeniaeformis]|uniref:WGS project CAEQ00000000 data, annotated contig n=1 Tax=Hydatigena taeniaeformis TaxID=6205 RepID=A0A0R3X0Y6_HYDTA|nr:unnamed protein product [Hydatigera taeniaeformis]